MLKDGSVSAVPPTSSLMVLPPVPFVTPMMVMSQTLYVLEPPVVVAGQVPSGLAALRR